MAPATPPPPPRTHPNRVGRPIETNLTERLPNLNRRGSVEVLRHQRRLLPDLTPPFLLRRFPVSISIQLREDSLRLCPTLLGAHRLGETLRNLL